MSTDTPVDIGQLIVRSEGVKGGRPCLAGTGITVHSIALLRMEGLSAEEILEEVPDLDLSRIYAALAYYYANKTEIEEDIKADQELHDRLAARHPRGWPPRPEQP